MTQQSVDKAREMVDKFKNEIPVITDFANDGSSWDDELSRYSAAKQCAIILCDEMIKEVSDNISHIGRGGLSDMKFWEQVKQAINQL